MKYLGETLVEQKDTPYKDYAKAEFALLFIMKYGGIDGAHHKDWVLDQVARILNDSPVTIFLAKWDNGQEEYRFRVGDSSRYLNWVAECKNGEDGPDTYSYEEGIAP
jgi:hypothetical protein